MQAEHLRIVAEMNLWREIHRHDPYLQRIVAHVLMLETLADMQRPEPSILLPCYDTREPDLPVDTVHWSDIDESTMQSSESPELEVDGEADFEWDGDDEPACKSGCQVDCVPSGMPALQSDPLPEGQAERLVKSSQSVDTEEVAATHRWAVWELGVVVRGGPDLLPSVNVMEVTDED